MPNDGMPNIGMPNNGMPNNGMPNLALIQEFRTTEYRMPNAKKIELTTPNLT
jgi:hypothetical protein